LKAGEEHQQAEEGKEGDVYVVRIVRNLASGQWPGYGFTGEYVSGYGDGRSQMNTI